MPKSLNNAKITQRLVESFQLKGRYIPMLDEVIVPVYVLDDPAPAEPNRLAAGTVEITAPGAGTTKLQLFNPPNSGVMTIVTFASIILSKAGGAADFYPVLIFLVQSDQVPSDGSTALNTDWRDTRIALDEPYTTVSSSAGGIAAGSQIITQVLGLDPAASLAEVEVLASPVQGPRQPPVVLKPSTGIVLQVTNPQAAGLTMFANFLWEEIPLLGSVGSVSGTPP